MTLSTSIDTAPLEESQTSENSKAIPVSFFACLSVRAGAKLSRLTGYVVPVLTSTVMLQLIGDPSSFVFKLSTHKSFKVATTSECFRCSSILFPISLPIPLCS